MAYSLDYRKLSLSQKVERSQLCVLEQLKVLLKAVKKLVVYIYDSDELWTAANIEEVIKFII